MTIRLEVVGDPIAHSLSPRIHQLFASQFNDDVLYQKSRVTLSEFAARMDAFRQDGWRGANVTVPLKTAAFDYVDDLDSSAAAAGAVNTIHFQADSVAGFNTDGWGLVTDVTQRWDVALDGANVLILGAGGATRGVIVPLFDAGARQVIIANRTVATAETLCHELSVHTSGKSLVAQGLTDAVHARVDLVVNATSIGLSDASLKLPLTDEQLAESFCYDMGYGSSAGFYKQVCSIARGAADGLGMLVEQAARSYEIWLGHAPDTDPVYQTLRAELATQ